MMLRQQIRAGSLILSLVLAFHWLVDLSPVRAETQEENDQQDLPDALQAMWRQHILNQMRQWPQDIVGIVQEIHGEDDHRIIVVERYVQDVSRAQLSRATAEQKKEVELEARQYVGRWLSQSVEFMARGESPQDRALAAFAKSYELETRRELFVLVGIEEILVRYPELQLEFNIPLRADGAGNVRRLSTGTLLDNAREKVYPRYPEKARRAGVRGIVRVDIVVDENGDVLSAEVVEGHPLLRDAALEAARQWKFQPFLVRGNPGRVSGTLTFLLTP